MYQGNSEVEESLEDEENNFIRWNNWDDGD